MSINVLFIHQNFPAQFKSLAPALVREGHNVRTLTIRDFPKSDWNGVSVSNYSIKRGTSEGIHPWILDFETKVIRGEACFNAALELKKSGYSPDIIVAHPGWGESMFLKEVWPKARLGLYCEFFYHPEGLDIGFDQEFANSDLENPCRIALKNTNYLYNINQADAGLAPTEWQARTFPESFRSKITVSHDGVDTSAVKPNKDVVVTINGSLKLTRGDQIVTYVARNLEPLRGAHIFLRAVPKILRENAEARILIAGKDDVGYGPGPARGGTWKEFLLNEIKPQLKDSEWGRLHFVGHLPYHYFLNLLQVSSVHVYLTYPFVLSWSLLEAMSVGCAVVASRTGPVTEVITDDSTGKLVDFFDIEGLAQQVGELLNDPQKRTVLGREARGLAIQNYDLTRVCLPRHVEWVEGMLN